jgi:cellulose synthase/poly-beta-1,6-N-acetylglucosamine synthase-like glycosyltransferase
MVAIIQLIGLLCTVVAGIHATWWLILAVVALPRPRARQVISGGESVVVVVPAHNEELMVASTVRSLRAASEQHAGSVEICVVADNCTDSTAQLALAAGATVFERNDPTRKGKSHALQFGLEQLLISATPPDIVAFVDADTEVSPEFIKAVADAVRRGASVVQVHYAPADGDEPIRRIRRLAFALIHWVRLGLGTSLKGNGMAYRWDIAAQGLGGSGIVEDAEMSLTLAERGIRVVFEPRATVWGHMAGDWSAAAVQDQRWEHGRLALFPRSLGALGRCIARNPRAANGAIEVMAFPLILVSAFAIAGAIIESTTAATSFVGIAPIVLILGYVLIGWFAARVAPRDLVGLASLPLYVVHKLRVLTSPGRRPKDWITTSRR